MMLAVALPLFAPKQRTLVMAVIDAVPAPLLTTVVVAVLVQPFASVRVIV